MTDKKTKQSTGGEQFNRAVDESIEKGMGLMGKGFEKLMKMQFRENPLLTPVIISTVPLLAYVAADKQLLPRVFISLNNDFTQHLYKGIHGSSWGFQFYLWLAVFFAIFLIVLGICKDSFGSKYEKLFERVGLKSGEGKYPRLISSKRVDRYKTILEYDAVGVSIDEITAKTGNIETAIGQYVEQVEEGKEPKRVEVTITKDKLPEYISYKELADGALPENSFMVGKSLGGKIVQDITKLPHMFIAGSTGGGKSVFFKQTLLSLLQSSDNIEMYLIDLKRGVEFKDFKGLSNVKIIKSTTEAATVLDAIQKEMNDRYEELEKNDKNEFIPSKSKSRIIVAIDEASLLFAKDQVSKSDRTTAMHAREAFGNLAKQGRAAGINLILATQKIEKSAIPTQVTDNIDGRMVFRITSIAGSVQALGNNKATKIKKIPGRGIWRFGQDYFDVQTPFISEEDVKEACQNLSTMTRANIKAIDEDGTTFSNDYINDAFGKSDNE